MENNILKIFLLTAFCLLLTAYSAVALPFRSPLNQANDQYKKGLYEFAERDYSKILKSKPKDQKAKFNLGNSLYKQNRFEESQELFEILTKEASSKKTKGQSYYNLGNSFFKQSNFEKAITAYTEALNINPNDEDAKHNLKLAEMMQKMPPQQRKQQQDKQKQQQQDKQNQGQGNDKQSKDKKQEQQQPKPGQMSKEDAERLLRAIENQEKHKNKGAAPRQGSGQGTGKDW